jgi:hypothetical protein
MAQNHPLPWMNSNTRLGAYLPIADDENRFAHRAALKWAGASPFFSQECARLSRIGREEKCAMSDTALRLETASASHNGIEYRKVANLSRRSLAWQPRRKSCDRPRPYSRGRLHEPITTKEGDKL